jgi:hypothetical protein
VRGSGLSRRELLGGGLVLTGAGLLTGFLGAEAAQAAAPPPIVACAGWGARPPSSPVTVLARAPIRILVHHTATPNSLDLTRAAADRLARSIQNYHMNVQGWLDTGQHFTISRGGVVLEGRHRSLDALNGGRDQIQGAHCPNQNNIAVGIENEGTYTSVDPPGALWGQLRSLCAYACAQYKISPGELRGHREFYDTACPGDRLFAMLPQLRREVAAALGLRAPANPLTWPLLRVADRGERVVAAQLLLRASGIREVPVDGEFGRSTADGVRRFQRERRLEEENGMIGGATWPLIATPVQAGDRGEAAQAVEALSARRLVRAPTQVDAAQWQRLLAAAA